MRDNSSAPQHKKRGEKRALFKVFLQHQFPIFKTLKDIFRTKKKRLRDCFVTSPFDMTFLVLVIAVLSVGLVMMFSASYIYAWYSSGTDDPFHYIKRQVIFAIIGIALMFLVSYIKPEIIRDMSSIIFLISLALLVIVLFFPHIIEGKEDFKRWLAIPGTDITFQPSEIAKFALITYLAFSLEKYQKLVEKKYWIIIPYILIVLLVCGLVALENHLSGTLLILGIGAAMVIFGGVRRDLIIGLSVCAVVLGTLAFIFAKDLLKDYAYDRIELWLKLLSNEELTSAELTGNAWQSMHSLYAIGSGGIFGLGFGNSRQKHLYIPEPQNDFVFAVVCEELGFIGAIIIIALFVLLVGRGFVIALRSRTKYGALLAMGISFQVGLQAALNIAVVTATVPNTGISLPFFSYGGTSLVMLLVEMGLILAVSRNTDPKKEERKIRK